MTSSHFKVIYIAALLLVLCNAELWQSLEAVVAVKYDHGTGTIESARLDSVVKSSAKVPFKVESKFVSSSEMSKKSTFYASAVDFAYFQEFGLDPFRISSIAANEDGSGKKSTFLQDEVTLKLHLPLEAAGQSVYFANSAGSRATMHIPAMEAILGKAQQLATKSSKAAATTVYTIIENNNPANAPNIAFLSEGYQNVTAFLEKVNTSIEFLRAEQPHTRYFDMWNVYAVYESSNDVGVTNSISNGNPTLDTNLQCYYWCSGIDRLLCCSSSLAIAMANNAPGSDVRVILANSDTYGGAGSSSYASSYTGFYMGGVVIHEMGHSDSSLADEYSYGGTQAWSSGYLPNCFSSTTTPWSGWNGIEGVSSFLSCSYDNFYRPTNNGCLMKTLMNPFCPVCREAVILKMYEHNPTVFRSYSPGPDYEFEIGKDILEIELLITPVEDMLIQWRIDGELVHNSTNVTVYNVSQSDISNPDAKYFNVSVYVEDLTIYVLPENRMPEMRQTLNYTVLLKETTPSSSTGSSGSSPSSFPSESSAPSATPHVLAIVFSVLAVFLLI